MKIKYALLILIAAACSTEKKASNEEIINESAPEEVVVEPSIVEIESRKRDVYDQLAQKGFVIELKGQIRFKEDNLVKVPVDSLASFIEGLKWRASKDDKLAIYLMRVAGAANENEEQAELFVKEAVLKGEYLDDLRRMNVFLERQPRHTIMLALHNIVDQMTTGQCIEYLEHIGYAKGRKGDLEFNSNKLKNTSSSFKVMLLNKLVNGPGKSKEIADQIKKDLGVKE